MSLEAQNNPFTSILMVEAADVEALPDADPAAGQRRLAVGTDHLLYLVSNSGVKTAVSGGGIANPLATDSLWDAAGDLVVGSGANTAAKLTIGATNGMALQRVSGSVAWALPSGYEYDYVQKTTNSSITATTAGAADTIVTGASVAYDGSTAVWIEFCSPFITASPVGGRDLTIGIFESTTEVGRIAYAQSALSASPTGSPYHPCFGRYKLTPSNASHTYIIKGWVSAGTGTVGAGAGGAAGVPMFMRIVKA